MSIYASEIVFDDTHLDHCQRWVETDVGILDLDESRPCTCGQVNAPLVYEGSHVLPADTDRRGGDLDVASIPSHIEREGRVDGREGLPKPWLRLSVGNEPSTTMFEDKPFEPAGSSTIVLDRSQVAELHAYLGTWLSEHPDPRGGG